MSSSTTEPEGTQADLANGPDLGKLTGVHSIATVAIGLNQAAHGNGQRESKSCTSVGAAALTMWRVGKGANALSPFWMSASGPVTPGSASPA